MNEITVMKYVIHGLQQQERVRARVLKKMVKGKMTYKATVYDPPKSKAFKQFVKEELNKQHPILFEGNLKATFTFYVPIPKSYTKKDRKNILEGNLLPSKKPDLSNYIKLIEDAANGILYKDDAQIVEMFAKKVYSDEPKTEILLEKI